MNLKKFTALFTALFLFGIFPLGVANASTESWPASTTGTDIDASVVSVSPGFEPSGAIWHSGKNQLFVVGDGGQLVSMNADGTNVTLWNVGGDLEGVTIKDPSSNEVYLLDENGYIIKYDLSTKTKLQTWNVSSFVPPTGGTGGEALAYVPGTNYFVVGWQKNGEMFVFDLSGTSPVKVTSFFSGKGRTDLADLYYENGYVYALYDSANILEVFTATVVDTSVSVSMLHEYTVPGADQEGFTLMPSATETRTAFIAQDTGGIISYTGFINFSYIAPTPEPVDPDNDGDGVVASLDCNDGNALYSTVSTWYLDNDADGLGAKNSGVEACEQPAGYVSNNVDAYDLIPNAGVEIPEDGIDNNMDGVIDGINLGYNHPYYSTFDPTTPRRAKIWSMWGSHHGDYGVRYGDTSIFRFSAFDVRAKALTSVYPILKTGYALVVFGDNVALVNAYKGENVYTTTFTALSLSTVDELKTWAQTFLGL